MVVRPAGRGLPSGVTRHPDGSDVRVHGFSLVELVIALSILAVGIVGAMRVFPVGLRASMRAEQVSRAALAAQRHLEPLMWTEWEQLDEGQTTVYEEPFTIVVTVDEPTVEGLVDPSRLKRVAARVSWPQEGRVRSLTLVSYVRRP